MRPMYQYGAADVRYGQSAQLSGQCLLDLSGSSSYSVGFWLRPRAPIYDGKVLSSGSSWYVGLHGLLLTFSLPGMASRQVSALELRANEWQYVLVNFESTGSRAGNYSVYVDGTLLIEGSQSNITSSTSPFVLGMSCDAQYFNVAFWSAAKSGDELKPLWEVPAQGPTLAACYSFSDGTSTDVSGNNHTQASFSSGAQVLMLAPALRLVNGVAQPSPRDNLTVSADGGPFSVQSWFHLETPSAYQSESHTLFSCLDAVTNEGFTLGLQWDGVGYNLQCSGYVADGKRGWGHILQMPPGGWHHLAATYDGSTLTLYLDGVLDMEIPGVVQPTLTQPIWLFGAESTTQVDGGAAHDFQGHLQGAALWSRALSATEVQQYMSQDPSDAEGCVAYYAWNGIVLGNQVTGHPPVLLNTATPDIVVTPPSDSTPPPGSNLAAQQMLVADPPLPSAKWSFAEQVAFPSQTLLTKDQAENVLESLEPLVASLPESMRERIRSLARNNLYQGLARVGSSGSPPVGAFTGQVEGNQYVFYHHTRQGKVEAGRMELSVNTQCIGWIVTVVATAFSLILSAFGVGFVGARLVSPIQKAVSESTVLLNTVENVAKSSTQDAGNIIRILKAFYTAGTLGKIFGAVLTGSWWSLAINCGLLMLQVAALWATGGAYLAILIIELAANFALFVWALTQKPSNC
ncbi:LamG domain-containing protein [Myxococcus stipitatus DSM 14675]|uniref:LamG domain-containing protein n=1 Tax=Myxococcus stipitatus (strain DSM 14675 / JCM 12634 / Mx s8) TaxID=1278073 RepID=L7UB83_MYXSD|nr:LamG-like jellyroll fold domain-containing protein [Myxococcus stipitatus]AGC45313.1 LamG domain-containing protein [Myxococcus stipitatus DSM 14675]